MSISLVKGQKIDVTKGNSGLVNVAFGLGWDTNKYDGDGDFDLDVSVFLADASGKVTGEHDFIFYNQPTHPSGAVDYSGDNRNGVGDGDDETIKVDLSKIPANISKISFTATIYDAATRLQNFGMVDNSYIRAYNMATNEELFKYELNEDFSLETGIVAGELYRHNGEWKFAAVGAGYAGGLSAIGRNFGLNI
jgi:tellurium resistance protein TerD